MRGATLTPTEALATVARKFDHLTEKYPDLGPSAHIALTAEALNVERVKVVAALRLEGRPV